MKKDIYLIRSISPSGDISYKIGISKSPSTRLKSLQTGNSNKLDILQTFQSNYASILETTLHNYFKSSSLEGEWFNLSDIEVESFLVLCDKLNSNIKSLYEEDDNNYYQNKLKRI